MGAISPAYRFRGVPPEYVSEAIREPLLIANPDPRGVAAFSTSGHTYEAVVDEDLSGAVVLAELFSGMIEIKNISLLAEVQGCGVGKKFLDYLIQEARSREHTVVAVSTGNSSLGPLALYQKAGFHISGITPDYFTNHYADAIEEHGIRCRDRIHLQLDLRKKNGA